MFRLIKNRGNIVVPPQFLSVPASGTIHPGGVVASRAVNPPNKVYPAASSTTYTQVFGISMDYTQSSSDVAVRVIPFTQGQLWEADCVRGMTTAMLFLRHALNSDLVVNNTSYDTTTATGIFLAYSIPNYVSAGMTNTFKVIGEFIRLPAGDQFGNQWVS